MLGGRLGKYIENVFSAMKEPEEIRQMFSSRGRTIAEHHKKKGEVEGFIGTRTIKEKRAPRGATVRQRRRVSEVKAKSSAEKADARELGPCTQISEGKSKQSGNTRL